jgi:hypothetical protein
VDAFWPKRRHARHPLELAVWCGDRQLPDHTLNLSIGGARIGSTLPLQVGAHFDFRFVVPDAKHRAVIVKAAGMVAWAARGEMGIQFEGRYSEIEAFIERLERSQTSP